ncbi:hypothetical protein, partial [Komarekiella delphini-convector]|uniref:hypothetical protein n=1 Tax=Komarekiella delphini-convector TaxID=3050158 RepID=UPI001CD8F24A
AFSNSSWLSEISIWNGRLITKSLNAPIYKFDVVWRVFIQNWYYYFLESWKTIHTTDRCFTLIGI